MVKESLSYRIARAIKAVPGYDPYATAGDCLFHAEKAEFTLDFIGECCSHVKGDQKGQAFRPELWEEAIIANLYGWYRPNGTRRYREAFIFVPRKNGKTFLVATLITHGLFVDQEPGAEIYSAAAEREQARLVFDQVKGMVLNEPELSRRAQIYKNAIVVGDNSYKAISAEAGTKHGFNSHLIIIDELHAQPNRELVDVLMTSTGSRKQPLVIHITTSDYEREGSICNEKHDYATKVRDGVIEDPSFLPVIYEAAREDDWTDPKIWAKANPNLGVSLDLEYLQRECQRARELPAFENTFKRLHLNIRTEQSVRWLPLDLWDACDGAVDPAALAGRECWAGLDLGSTQDLTALVLVFPEPDETYSVLPYFWIPADTARVRSRRDRVPYLDWINSGHLLTTSGDETEYDTIEAAIVELSNRFAIQEIAADRLFQGAQTIQRLRENHGLNAFPHGQGFYGMAAPSKTLEEILVAGKLRHGGHPILRWMASNVTVDFDPAGNMKPNKAKSGEKIDGIVALIMALGRCAIRDKTGSVYEERGVLVL